MASGINNEGNQKHSADFVPAWRSPWVWGMAGLVMFALAVNAVMITVGLSTHPGLVVEDFYDRGKNYFRSEVVREDAAARLGWKLQLEAPAMPVREAVQTYRLVLDDRAGLALGDAKVTFAAFRPSNAKLDFEVPMAEIESGLYVAELSFPQPGNWDLIVSAQRGEDKMDLAQRLFVKD